MLFMRDDERIVCVFSNNTLLNKYKSVRFSGRSPGNVPAAYRFGIRIMASISRARIRINNTPALITQRLRDRRRTIPNERGHTKLLLFIPVVVGFAVQLAVAHIARIVQRHTAHSARQALFVPAGVADPHQIPVVDFLAAALAQLVVLLAFDDGADLCFRPRGQISKGTRTHLLDSASRAIIIG